MQNKNMLTFQKPQLHEFAPYYGKYINLVMGDDILESLASGRKTVQEFLVNLPQNLWDYAYAPGKWTIKEGMIHVIDTERIMAYRALRVARKDSTPLPGFEQDNYVAAYFASRRSIQSILEEYNTVRTATISLFKNLPPEVADQLGTASDCPVTPQALAYIIAGHEIHHLNIFKERYLKNEH